MEIIDGPRAGTAFGQTVCVSWYDETPGYYFGDLPLALPVTLRATAVGYRASERVVAPTRDLSYTGDLVLTKSP